MSHWVMVLHYCFGVPAFPAEHWLRGEGMKITEAFWGERMVPERCELKGSAGALTDRGRWPTDGSLSATRPESLQRRFPIGATKQQRYNDYSVRNVSCQCPSAV